MSLQFYGCSPRGHSSPSKPAPGDVKRMCVTQHVSLRVRSPLGARLRGGAWRAWHEDPYSGQLPLPGCRQAEEPA